MNFTRKMAICMLVSFFLFGSQSSLTAAAAPLSAEIFAEGELCTETYGMVYCFPLTFTFNSEGGPVNGQSSGSISFPIEGVGTIASSFTAVFEGTFFGGDGGTLEGTWTSTANVTLPDGLSMPADVSALMQSNAGGSWVGNLNADGTGAGSFQTLNPPGGSGGTWYVSYPGAEFELPQPTPTSGAPAPIPTVIPSQTPTPPIPTIAASPPPTLDPNALLALGDLQSAIQRKLALIQSGGVSDHPAIISPWLYGQMVRVEVEEETPVVSDIYGHRVEVDENGLPQSDPSVIDSPSADIVNDHPDLDWSSLLDSIGESAYNAFSNFTEPSFQFIEQTTEGVSPAEIANSFYDFINQLSVPLDETVSSDDSTVVKSEVAYHESNKQTEEQQVELRDGEKIDVEEAVERVQEEEKNTWYDHYVNDLEIISAERWEELVEQGIDPVKLIQNSQNNRESIDEAVLGFNQFFGEKSISELAVKYNLIPEEVNTMTRKLRELGVRSEDAEKMAQATLALRVITELGADHSIGSDLSFDGVIRAFRFLALHKAGTDAFTKDMDLSEAQMEIIMNNRAAGIFKELTDVEDPEQDPFMSALIAEIERREK